MSNQEESTRSEEERIRLEKEQEAKLFARSGDTGPKEKDLERRRHLMKKDRKRFDSADWVLNNEGKRVPAEEGSQQSELLEARRKALAKYYERTKSDTENSQNNSSNQ
eukprot:gb/GECH01013415.1/.p1 GENE.gb/GECH01013415.1/~~gb/GECH01013415.1/.p1  ORF type:complete len:108 (+),score=32.25 gb/GECH01013415.1/:1-324(+)